MISDVLTSQIKDFSSTVHITSKINIDFNCIQGELQDGVPERKQDHVPPQVSVLPRFLREQGDVCS